MTTRRVTTIAEYIQVAPRQAQPHLQRLYQLLKSVAPDADEVIKWGVPFFVEPRFLFAFSAYTKHLNFTPNAQGLEPFRKELEAYNTTQGSLQLPYNQPLPDGLILKLAQHRVWMLSQRKDDAFW